MNELRSKVINHISEHKDVWTKVLTATYVLVTLDRIGQAGIQDRGGVPGLWGFSYIRTYYDWIGTPPTDTVQMEGGIATTYFVVKNLNRYLKRVGTSLDPEIRSDLVNFFVSRTDSSGTGINTTDSRGIPKVETNLRHTCFAYLTMCEIESDEQHEEELEAAINYAGNFIITSISQEDLLGAWMKESWPIGGIASYISARQHLFESDKRLNWRPFEKSVWPAVQLRLIDALVSLDSRNLNYMVNLFGSKQERHNASLKEHYPYWEPIKNLETLRLHSTLGCLSLVGEEIWAHPKGRVRIKDIASSITQQVVNSIMTEPSFNSAGEISPSISAALAILKLVLGKWYEITSKDEELIFILLKFVEENWDNPAVYQDYWSEFTAPLLDLEELHQGLGDQSAKIAYEDGNKFLEQIKKDKKNLDSKFEFDSTIHQSLSRVLPIALGNKLI